MESPLRTGRIPDFIIIGAQKSGTTTLHYLLDHHPEISIPDGEVNYWTRYDYHENRSLLNRAVLKQVDPKRIHHFETQLQHYQSYFPYDPQLIIGEDSTTYLSSGIAASQLAKISKDLKLIVMLRDPVKRAYSHYWHQVTRGRATLGFWDYIKYDHNILRRSEYGAFVSTYLSYFPREQLHFIVFEEFIIDIQITLDSVCKFLSLEDSIDVNEIETHKNRSLPPRFVKMQLWFNRLFGTWTNGDGSVKKSARGKVYGLLNKVHTLINPPVNMAYPAMTDAEQDCLRKLFWTDIQHLSELIEQDMLATWGWTERKDELST